ncbi:VanZ family protein [Desulfuromonas acetoxidans]|uniref:VanZ like protein n=1 Tax=Desulfuromonas acetoxidans (strain DSM 684 / 11070) TaxID=281689 RepID=Q1K422_DESA6|nr:VanZ family protein [Desulfuromonas acetoxidans]EAT17281.1 VanZ like protein [Desulfuromonas acetoxidans DSM 684]MBF0646155.1 VanZ family protein [Desulfuromonas acetoxidans]NVD25966.1 VanZ family protein [Desulfuromonas acetoxidans]NVE15098.1 VanZ family protein [Desulfuromonas acetoxidans]
MNKSSLPRTTNSCCSSRLLIILACVYFFLLVYASLMPYDFRASIDIRWVINKALHAWPVNPYAQVSGSDVLSNLILYIPLGALLATHWATKHHHRMRAALAALMLCSLTSLLIETGQIFLLSRTASITDFIMNTISGAVGAVVGARWGPMLWQQILSTLHQRQKHSPLDLLTLVFAALIAADALAPFLPTLLIRQVWRSIKASQFNPIAGFSQHPWHWWLVTHILLYLVFTLLVAQWSKPNHSKPGRVNAALFCGLFATMLEVAKLFITSRVMNMSNLMANYTGIFVAVILLTVWRRPLSRELRLTLGLIGVTGYILYLGWLPFDFQFDAQLFTNKLPRGVEFLPFYHYAMGASLNHIRLFLQTILLSATLVYFYRLRFATLDQRWFRLPVIVLLTGTIGLLQEGGQLFLTSRTPSMTDIYCYIIGGILATRIPLLPLDAPPAEKETHGV